MALAIQLSTQTGPAQQDTLSWARRARPQPQTPLGCEPDVLPLPRKGHSGPAPPEEVPAFERPKSLASPRLPGGCTQEAAYAWSLSRGPAGCLAGSLLQESK